GALVTVFTGSVDLIVGRVYGALDAWSQAIVLAALGGLAVGFSYLGHTEWRNRPFSAALLLMIVAVLAALTGGPGMGALALIGAMLVGLSGVLYVIEPMKRAAHYAATA
ncbi:MAG: hypothetical protein L3K08_02210, partial [Thermoplasmata archaeon]|nr:hypothetical protein [Thermoplasmata archaeon]